MSSETDRPVVPAVASWPARYTAMGIDLLISVAGTWFLLSAVLFGTFEFIGTGPRPWEDEIEGLLPILFITVPLAGCLVYLAIGWSRGRTIGMTAAHTALVRFNGRMPGVARGNH